MVSWTCFAKKTYLDFTVEVHLSIRRTFNVVVYTTPAIADLVVPLRPVAVRLRGRYPSADILNCHDVVVYTRLRGSHQSNKINNIEII